MEHDPIILATANRHGVADEDLLHALRFERHHFVQEGGLVMVIGADRRGVLIEVGLVQWHGELVVVHGLRPARVKFL